MRMTHEEQVKETQAMIKEQLRLLKSKVRMDDPEQYNYSGTGGPSFVSHQITAAPMPAHSLYTTLMAIQDKFNQELKLDNLKEKLQEQKSQ